MMRNDKISNIMNLGLMIGGMLVIFGLSIIVIARSQSNPIPEAGSSFTSLMDNRNDDNTTSAQLDLLYEGITVTVSGIVEDVIYRDYLGAKGHTRIDIETTYKNVTVRCYVHNSLSDQVIATFKKGDPITCTGETRHLGEYEFFVLLVNATPLFEKEQ
jgi:hypothetical protein